jgi:hypothetical protein
MKMYVEDILTRVFLCVEDYSVASVFDSLIVGDLSGFCEYTANHMLFFFRECVERGEVVFGDEKDMDRGLRTSVFKSENIFVFIHDPGWDFFFYDFAKNAAVHIRTSPSQ